MPLLKLTGKESVLTLYLEHPLHLEDSVNYKLALVGFYSDNNIYNLRQQGNVFFWDNDIAFIPTPLSYSAGYWTIETIQNYAREFLKSLKLNINEINFKIERNNGRIIIYSPIKFYLDAVMCTWLGFTPQDKSINEISTNKSLFYEVDQPINAPNPPNLRLVDVIEIQCDIIQNSCVKHDIYEHKHNETSILHSFFPNVPHGYKISEIPNERHYIPIKKGLNKIQKVTITIKDQDNQLVQNSDVNNIIYLDLITQ